MVARGDAAGHLQVDEAVLHPIAPHRFAQHQRQGLAAHRHGDAQLSERALQPGVMALRVGELAAEHRPDLVDPVGQLVAAVLDMHAGLGMGHEATVDVGDA